MVGLAQLVRVPDCDSGGRGFDSHSSPHIYIGVSPSGKASDFDSDIQWFKSIKPCQFNNNYKETYRIYIFSVIPVGVLFFCLIRFFTYVII